MNVTLGPEDIKHMTAVYSLQIVWLSLNAGVNREPACYSQLEALDGSTVNRESSYCM